MSSGLEEQTVSSSILRIRSFSLDQLRNSKIQTAPNAVAEAESKEEDGHKAEGHPPLIDAVDATPKVMQNPRTRTPKDGMNRKLRILNVIFSSPHPDI